MNIGNPDPDKYSQEEFHLIVVYRAGYPLVMRPKAVQELDGAILMAPHVGLTQKPGRLPKDQFPSLKRLKLCDSPHTSGSAGLSASNPPLSEAKCW